MIEELRRIHRRRIARLRELSVDVRELSAAEGREALACFDLAAPAGRSPYR